MNAPLLTHSNTKLVHQLEQPMHDAQKKALRRLSAMHQHHIMRVDLLAELTLSN
jgi:hypothetical protein